MVERTRLPWRSRSFEKITNRSGVNKEEIPNIDYFNKLTKADFGKLIFHGIDEDGHSVYKSDVNPPN